MTKPPDPIRSAADVVNQFVDRSKLPEARTTLMSEFIRQEPAEFKKILLEMQKQIDEKRQTEVVAFSIDFTEANKQVDKVTVGRGPLFQHYLPRLPRYIFSEPILETNHETMREPASTRMERAARRYQSLLKSGAVENYEPDRALSKVLESLPKKEVNELVLSAYHMLEDYNKKNPNSNPCYNHRLSPHFEDFDGDGNRDDLAKLNSCQMEYIIPYLLDRAKVQTIYTAPAPPPVPRAPDGPKLPPGKTWFDHMMNPQKL